MHWDGGVAEIVVGDEEMGGADASMWLSCSLSKDRSRGACAGEARGSSFQDGEVEREGGSEVVHVGGVVAESSAVGEARGVDASIWMSRV